MAALKSRPRRCLALAKRFNPLARFLSLVALSLGASYARQAGLALIALLSVLCLAAGGAIGAGTGGLRRLAHDARFLIPLGVLVTAFRVIDPGSTPFLRFGELLPSLVYLGRLACLFLLAEAFFLSTTAGELSAAATRLARAATRRSDVDPGLYLSLAVGFIPRCFASWESVREAALVRGYGTSSFASLSRLRGGHRPRPRIARRFSASLLVLGAFLVSAIRGAIVTTEALEARGYSPSRAIPPSSFRAMDALLVAISAALAMAAHAAWVK
jgi:energy-coupling factor transporter transmembrane protein EcfT